MRDGWLALRPVDLSVQVAEARHGGVGQLEQRFDVQSVGLEVVVQGAIFMVVCDQVELRPGACSFDICCDETW